MSQEGSLKLDYGDNGSGVSLDGIIAGVVSKGYFGSTANGGGAAYRFRARAGFSVKAFLAGSAASVVISVLAACGGGASALPTAPVVPSQAAPALQALPAEPAAPTLAAPASAPTLEATVQATLEPTPVAPVVPATVAPTPTAAPPPTRAPAATPTPQPNVQVYNHPDNGPVYVNKDGILLAGLVNSGNAPATDISARLLVDGKEVYRWTVQELKPSGVSFGAVSLATISSQYSLASGLYDVTVVSNGVSVTKSLNLNFPEPRPKPSVPVSLADLVPVNVVLLSEDGKVLNSGVPYQPGRKVGVALKNDSSVGVDKRFSYSLFVNGKRAESGSVPKLGPGEVVAATVSLDSVVAGLKLRSSVPYVFELVVDSDNDVPELNEGNANVFATSALELKVAKDPVPRRAPQSPTEAKIQGAFDNFTWYTSANASELVGIAKEVLKDVPIDWSRIRVSVLPFDEFNEKYAKTFPDRGSLGSIYRGWGFVIGTTRLAEVYLREGILPQVLPTLFREVSGADYNLKNLSGARKALSVGITGELFQGFFTAYGVSVLIEDFGWAGLTNASYLVGTEVTSFGAVGLPSWEIDGMWVAAFKEGYKDGNVPSNVWLRLYNQFIQMPDPTDYIKASNRQAIEMDDARTIEISKSRLVDKEPTLLPAETSRKLNPHNPSEGISLDSIVLRQEEFFHPVPYSAN